MSVPNLSTNEAESDYFKINPPPRALDEHSDLTQAFVNYHVRAGRRVVLVTSGGTTVPLETQTVRFIDNFSAGTRGATSAEYFLEEGYAVIFLHRQFSLLPYSRHFSHSTNCFLDFMDETPTVPLSDGHDRSNPDHSSIVVRAEYQNEMRDVLRKYRYAKENNLLLLLPYVSVTEYLYELRMIATTMKPLGPNALFYLAAAVSDFFIPRDRMVEHKIQSSNEKPIQDDPKSAAHVRDIPPDKIYTGFNDPQPPTSGKKLVIDLDPVPKFLHRLVDGWAPEGSMIISFKLETDPSLLISKSEQALQRYSHHLVIGNLLSTRKWEVVFVTKGKDGKAQERWIRAPKAKNARRPSITQIHSRAGTKRDESTAGGDVPTLRELEIESLIVPNVAEMHTGMIRDWSAKSK